MNTEQYILKKADLFRLLAACFYEPDKQLFTEEQLCHNLSGLLQEFVPDAVETTERMDHAVKNLSQEELSVDHATLFIGPFELLAPPYGSVYMDGNLRQVMTDATMDVLGMYREAGLEVEAREPPDHIAIELEFLSFLASREAEAFHGDNPDEADTYLAQQRDFFSSAMVWIPPFCKAIQRNAETAFYNGLGICLEKLFTRMDSILRSTREN